MFWLVTSFFGTLLALGIWFTLIGLPLFGAVFCMCALLCWFLMMKLA